MNETKKRNIIIGTLCGVLLLMAVGYAAFNTILNINGTASISSNWDIKITNIVSKNGTEGASNAEDPTFEDLTATFSTNLVSPGDSIEYDVTIENQGTLEAELNKITLPQSSNEAIIITTSGIEVGDSLESQGSAVLTVKVEYNPNITKQPDNLTANFEMKLDYVQKGASEAEPQTVLSMKGVEVPIVAEGDGNDGLYEDPVEPGRYVYAGAKPNNYITFNGETWRIISVETDGTIKIMHQGLVSNAGEMKFDSEGARDTGYCGQGDAPTKGCNAWTQTTNFHDALNQYSGAVDDDSEMKKYLNGTYYDSITKNKSAIENHIFYYGGANENDYLVNQIKTEKEFGVASNVGLIQVSDYLKANSNSDKCGTYGNNNANSETCKNTNYMVNWMSSGYYWMITPLSYSGDAMGTSRVFAAPNDGRIRHNFAYATAGLVPSVYLKSDVELAGQGTESQPYTITNYVD